MDWIQISKSLEELGYFRYLSSTQKKTIPQILTKLKSNGYMFSINVGRDYPADEEAIGEGGVKYFLSDIKHILRTNNIKLTSIVEDPTPSAYRIVLNGKEYILCEGEEFNQSASTVQHIITQRLFAVINSLFKDAGSEERIFSLYNGNDHVAIFLTHDLYDLLAKSDFADDIKELRLYEE